MTLPNFFIVGAPKAGTDELYYHLDQHPEIYMSPLKEPCYFSQEIRPQSFHPSLRRQAELTVASTRKYLNEGMLGKRFGGIVSDPIDYQRLFASVAKEKAIGEGSVCYLWSHSAPPAIAAATPDARIIIVLMDPSERAFHQYLKSISDGTVRHSFRKHLDTAMRQQTRDLNVYHPFLAFGEYFDQVRRYMECFPPHQLNISLLEDTRADREAWFSGILRFLEVDDSFTPRHIDVPSRPLVPRAVGMSHALGLHRLKRRIARAVLPDRVKRFAMRMMVRTDLPVLLPDDRATLVEYYRRDILKLQDLISRDLSGWLH